MEKGGQQSRATVPLNEELFLLMCTLSLIIFMFLATVHCSFLKKLTENRTVTEKLIQKTSKSGTHGTKLVT
jgi:hypothetical protein